MAKKKFLTAGTVAFGTLAALGAYLVYKGVSGEGAESSEGLGSPGGSEDSWDVLPFGATPEQQAVITGGSSGAGASQLAPTSPAENVAGEVAGSGSTSEPQANLVQTSIVQQPDGSYDFLAGARELFTDAAVAGGAVAGGYTLPKIGRFVSDFAESKIPQKVIVEDSTPLQKFLKDPYGVQSVTPNKAVAEGGVAIAEKSLGKAVAPTAIGEVVQTAPKWATGLKGFANLIPFLDIPIGAALDVYFTRKDARPLTWGEAITGNVLGEVAQLGVAGTGAAVGTVVPVAGNIAGGAGGWIVGTGADIGATEAYYKAIGKSSIFDLFSPPSDQAAATPAVTNIKGDWLQRDNADALKEALGLKESSMVSRMVGGSEEDASDYLAELRSQSNISTLPDEFMAGKGVAMILERPGSIRQSGVRTPDPITKKFVDTASLYRQSLRPENVRLDFAPKGALKSSLDAPAGSATARSAGRTRQEPRTPLTASGAIQNQISFLQRQISGAQSQFGRKGREQRSMIPNWQAQIARLQAQL